MKDKVLIYNFIFLCLVFFSFPISATSKILCKVGVVPQFEQRRLFASWNPILKQIESRTECKFELVGTNNIEEFRKEFMKGSFDFAYMNPYHAIMANRSHGYLPLVRSGSKKLKGIMVVRKDSEITELSQINKKTIAFPSPSALGATLLMQAELANFYGIYVDPIYVKTHSSVYLHVGKNLAIAGGGVQRTFNEQPDFIKKTLRVIHETQSVHAHPFVVHPRISHDLRLQVQTAWLALSQEQPHLMAKIPMQNSVVATMDDYLQDELLWVDKFVVDSGLFSDN